MTAYLVAMALGALALGAVAWTFLEYAIHGWVGHVLPNRTPFRQEHMAHHRNSHYFTPTPRKARAAAGFLVPLGLLASLVVGWLPGLAFAAGLSLMYVAYEVLHRRAHTHPPRGRYSRWLRRHHFHHHYQNPRANHGVTTPLWDLVFGTYQRPGRIPVPRKHAMDWLCDPATGEVLPRYAADYALR
jgi:sterol desaturase/sphingolipid hydroxylase (fatty acid hydroxylase superfamily)